MNYRPTISTDGGKTFSKNGQVFATESEARYMAADIFSRWMLATDYGVEETTDPVNYKLVGSVLSPVEATPVVESEGGEHD